LIIESYPKSEQENAGLMGNHQAQPCQRASQKSCAEVKRSRKVVSDYIGMAERGSFIQAPGGAAELAGIIQDAQPAKDKRRPCTGLLAHVLVEKFADHLPRYRQSAIYAREGVDLEPRQPSCTRPIYGRH
jgi:hypothetical protein